MKYPFPQCFGDPNFIIIVQHCINEPEFIDKYVRLTGKPLSLTPSKQDKTFMALAKFVHTAVYMRMPAPTTTEKQCKP